MITGEVTADREAIVSLPIVGASGEQLKVEAVLDTGFTDHLTLPLAMIAMLQLPYIDSSEFTLADGSTVTMEVYRATVVWDGLDRAIPILAAEGGALAGMSLLYGSRLTLDVVDGGTVTVEKLL